MSDETNPFENYSDGDFAKLRDAVNAEDRRRSGEAQREADAEEQKAMTQKAGGMSDAEFERWIRDGCPA